MSAYKKLILIFNQVIIMFSEENTNYDFGTLKANLYLLATEFNDLKTYLAGYNDFGIYQECLYDIREPMEEFPAMIGSKKLSLETISKIFECYYLMESLARHPLSTNNEESFKNDEQWNRVRILAKQAGDLLPD